MFPWLIRSLEDSSYSVRRSSMTALARLAEPEGTVAIIRMLGRDPVDAKFALIHMGPPVEPYMLDLLKHEVAKIRHDACIVLREIGTEKCLKGLDHAATQDTSDLVRAAAKRSADIIRDRNV